MLKALGAAVAMAAVALLMFFAIFQAANSFTVPVPYEDYNNCLYGTQNAREKQPDCSREETVWQRGLRDPVAQYTLWITWFTGVLTVIGLAQGFINYRQIQLARDEFNATHRPTLEVRFVREVPAGIEITVINTGTGVAKFVAARAELRSIVMGEPLPSPHDISAGGEFDLLSEFEPSGSYTHIIERPRGPGGAFEHTFGGPLHVFGWIIYDTIGPTPVRRTTYFGRRVEILQPELVPVEGSDWNFIQ